MELADLKKYKLMKMDQLVEANWNWKEDDDFLAEQLANNLKRNGQIENIIVRELDTGAFEVVNGNHRYRAMQKLGASKIIAYNLGAISTQEAERIAYETNETRFKSDPIKVADVLNDMLTKYDVDDLLETLPHRRSDLDTLIDLKKFSWDDYKKSDPDQDLGATDGASKSPDGFERIELNLPVDVASILKEEIARIKNVYRTTTNNDCPDITAYEILALLIRDMSDETLRLSIFGDEQGGDDTSEESQPLEESAVN